MPVKAIPEGYNSLTPYMISNDAAAAIEFYKSAFGATELVRMPGPGGKVGHAELRIGDSMLMLADEHLEMGAKSLKTIGGTPIKLMLYVEDVDAVVTRAIAAGGKPGAAVENKFYGDRMGSVIDPFGYEWYVATHIEDVSPGEMAKRAKAAAHGGA